MDRLLDDAVQAGMKAMDRSGLGDAPMARAWDGAAAFLVEASVARDPHREGAIRLTPLEIPPGPTPYETTPDKGRQALVVLTLALASWWFVTPWLVLRGVSPSPGAFVATLAGALAGLIPRWSRRRVDRDQVEARLRLLARLAWERLAPVMEAPPSRDDRELSRALYELHRSTSGHLEAAAEALLIEASNLGYQGLSGVPGFVQPLEEKTMTWGPPVRERYEAFGGYDDGEPVVEERPPVVRDGAVVTKGLVRRARP